VRIRRVRLVKLVGLALAAGLAVALTGCAQPGYRFISNDDRDLVLRVPRSWQAIDTSEALKASGVDPATRTGWVAFYDAATQPAVGHLQAPSTDDPLLIAQTMPLTKEQGQTLTGNDLVEMLLPSTPEARAAAVKAHTFAVLAQQNVSAPNEHGAHIRYRVKIGTTAELFDRISLTDPKHTSIYVVSVHCSERCFTAHSAEIDDAVTSLTLKAH
jgi:hypothetical protein